MNDKYVKEGYSKGYTEGDSAPSQATDSPTNCDLTSVLKELNILKEDNKSLKLKIDNVLSHVLSNKTLSLSINDKISSLDTKIETSLGVVLNDVKKIPTSSLTIADIEAKIPFVDDMSLKVFTKGTKVTVTGFDGVCTVVSSSLLPSDDFTYFVVYTVSHTLNGVLTNSNFGNMQVVKHIPPSND